jgi:hypothetical protein
MIKHHMCYNVLDQHLHQKFRVYRVDVVVTEILGWLSGPKLSQTALSAMHSCSPASHSISGGNIRIWIALDKPIG